MVLRIFINIIREVELHKWRKGEVKTHVNLKRWMSSTAEKLVPMTTVHGSQPFEKCCLACAPNPAAPKPLTRALVVSESTKIEFASII